MNYKTFETQRLYLRPTTEVDADFIFELLNTQKWLQFIGDRGVHSVEAAKAYIENKMTPQLERLGYASYTVIIKEKGTKIGSCGLYDREGLEGIDLGFAFLPDYERKGYAFEASEKLVSIALPEFTIQQLSAITSKENTASQKLLIKLGFLHRGEVRLPEKDEELLLYQLQL